MFTGIVQGIAPIIEIRRAPDLLTLTIRLPSPQPPISIGASISLNGVCLTVVAFKDLDITFNVIQQTLSVTNLSEISVGTVVNFERAATLGSEIGGHQVSGHIDGTGTVRKILKAGDDVRFFFEVRPELTQYIFAKGYVAINGASLTVVDVDHAQFSIALIPETLQKTTFGTLREGSIVNIEVDRTTQAFVETVKRLLPELIKKLGSENFAQLAKPLALTDNVD